MTAPASRVPARYFALLCNLLKGRGLDADAALQVAGIWPTQLEGPDATLTLAQMEALIIEAQRLTGRADFSFELGRNIKLSSHEILGFGILTSPTFDYAMQLASRYYRLITPTFKMQYVRGKEHAELRFQPVLQLSPEVLQFMLEVVVVSTQEQLKVLAGGALSGFDIHVSYATPANAAKYRELRPARFFFGSEPLPGARMVLDINAVAQPLPMADAAARQMAEARCEQLLRNTAQSGRMTEWITMMLRESQEGMPSLTDLARLVNQSVRTLDRQLGREGSRFLDISKRVRHEKACTLLRSGELSVTQIAYQLGYGDVANFTRAFKRESGVSPSMFREGLGDGSAPAT
ncbi:MAG TPA: AraC family transcriptional regulator ligand-binding domain-containing protein [Nevskiaceae bacterium]|nr:AraC family transcriptional regulator ligand-binding domain-containing protein [Nevskiaceae bacterium]